MLQSIGGWRAGSRRREGGRWYSTARREAKGAKAPRSAGAICRSQAMALLASHRPEIAGTCRCQQSRSESLRLSFFQILPSCLFLRARAHAAAMSF